MEFLEFLESIKWWVWIFVFLAAVAIRDIFFNKRNIIKHNFPVIGHLRFLLTKIGPELRQYIVANDREELPFNRNQREWIYSSAVNGNNYQGFGTDEDIYGTNYTFINNAMLGYQPPEGHPNHEDPYFIPCAKVMGKFNKRKRPFRPASIINVSAMSFGSLSAKAVESLNKGCLEANAYQNTGEGGFSPYHDNGADVVFQIGTAYFGVRNPDGTFSLEKLVELTSEHPQIRAVEIKLSQGAKPGKGGVLPASKITEEIAKIRHVPLGKDVLSPPVHTAFRTIPEMLDFIEKLAEATGLPIGIKSAVGQLEQWRELVQLIKKRGSGPDFVTVDGGEGGTGAAPPSFADHVSLPFINAFTDVYKIFKEHDITERVVFIASGKLGFPAKAAMAFSMGADCINVAREAMLSIGCIQAKVCHNNTCPTGITTQDRWLQAGINVKDKSRRLNYYFTKFKKEFLEIAHAAGYEHPCQFTMHDTDINLSDKNITATLESTFGYHKAKVAFTSVQDLKDCPYLGGTYSKGVHVETKEAETEETSVSDQ